MAELAFVGFGSNVGDPPARLAGGLAALTARPGIDLVATSSLYATAPVGYVDQPDFLNAVVLLRSRLDARALLRVLHQVEALHQRRRQIRWGPRTLDLDLLLYGRQRSATVSLQLPHPYLLHRAFVMVPLVELAPDLRHPTTGLPVRRYLAACDCAQTVARLGDFPR